MTRSAPRRKPRGIAVGLCLAVTVSALTGCSTHDGDAAPPTTAGRPVGPGQPGDLESIQQAKTVPGARTVRMTYRSIDVRGEPSLATGLIVTPDDADAGAPVVAWGHATTGTGDVCAPSLQGAAGIPFIELFVQRGWIVVAADYEGLGAVGAHPYLVARSEARAILDAVRAAAHAHEAQVSAQAPVVLWGFSQGGHAVLAAAAHAEAMAPELDVRGVAAAAAVSDVRDFLERSMRPDQLGVVISIAHGVLQAAPDLGPSEVFTDDGIAEVDAAVHRCIAEVLDAANQPVEALVHTDPVAIEAWRAVLDAQRSGDSGVGIPVLLLHGEEDEVIAVDNSRALFDRLCAAGDPVQLVLRPGEGHGVEPEPDLTAWIGQLLEGAAMPSDCSRG